MPDRPRRGACARLAAMALGVAFVAETARAQEVRADGVVVYPRAWFERFAPRTAYDMVQQAPGFVLEEMVEARGLAAAGGNVLVDGRRPTAKSGGLAEVLSRIPAGGVARIEVSQGAAGASETQGQALIVNVVRAQAAGHGAWKLALERPGSANLNVIGEASASRQLAGWDVTGKVQGQRRRTVYVYYQRRNVDADGDLTQYQEEVSPAVVGDLFLSADASRRLAGGDLALSLRLGAEASTRDRARVNYPTDAAGAAPVSGQELGDDIETYSGELGLEWDRASHEGWSVKLAGLGGWNQTGQDQWNQDPARRQRSNFGVDETAVEAVGRATVSRAGTWAPEFGAEVAYNRLDSVVTASLERDGAIVAGSATQEDTVVEELRGEAFANLDWTVSPRLTTEAGLAAEVSQISVGGTRSNQQSFVFVKPSAALNYRVADGVQARLSLQRRVGQLDFSNFAAWASFSDGRASAGNAELGPEQVWRVAGSLDMRADKRGALNVELFYEHIDDVLEQAILNEDGAIGLANLGTAQRWGVTARGTLPLAQLLPGARLEAVVNWKDSRFEDPLTGEARTLTYFTPLTGNIAFRQDLQEARLAWGVKAVFREQDFWWFVDERNVRFRGAAWSAFVETTRYFGLKARLDLENIGQRRNGEVRRFYDPDRTTPIQGLQLNRRADRQWAKLTLSREF